MAVVAETAALMGIIGFSIGVFELSIKGLVLLSRACNNYDKEVSGIKLMIELEIHKLFAWASEAGLTRNPGTLLVDIKDAPLVPRILEYLKELVNDLDKLKSVYGLQVQQTSDQITTLDDEEAAPEKLGMEESKECGNMLKRIFKRRKSPWLRLKWVIVDEEKIRKLLFQIQHFILELQNILNRAQQARLQKSLDILLRNAVMSSADQQELDLLGSRGKVLPHEEGIAAAARLKKQGLLLGLLETVEQGHGRSGKTIGYTGALAGPSHKKYNDEVGVHLSTRGLSITAYGNHGTRFFACLDHRPVLLEFRNHTNASREFTTDHVRRVAAFLHHLDPSFHALSCLGYVVVHHRYAHVFDLGAFQVPAKSHHHHSLPYRTLRHLLIDLPPPSLNYRFSLAITILETLLQLHTAGWLHKELRPENVLFVRASHHRLQDFLHADVRVTGYSYARADENPEMTVPVPSEVEADLYRHPAYLQRPRVPFQRAFDLFSVGCMLLELGIWSTLPRLLEKGEKETSEGGRVRTPDLMMIRQRLLFTPTASVVGSTTKTKAEVEEREERKKEIWTKLAGCAGETYAGIVEKMIHFPISQPGISTATAAQRMAGEQDLVRLEIESLEKLRTISQVL